MKNFFTLEGRIDCLSYFYILLFTVVVRLVTILMNLDSTPGSILSLIILIGCTWVFVCAVVKRFHDLDMSGANFWRLFIPLYNIYLMFGLLLFRKGTVGANTYGNDPLESRVISASALPIISEKVEQVGGETKLIFIIIAVALAVLFVAYLVVMNLPDDKSSNTSTTKSGSNVPTPQTSPITSDIPKDTPPEPPKTRPISNPDYVKNPSAYVVDDSVFGKFSWGIKDQIVWVEGSVDSDTLKFSAVIVRGGEKILKVVTYYIPWLQNFARYGNYEGLVKKEQLTSNERCWEDGAREWLQQNIEGKRIAFLDEGPYYYRYLELMGNYRWLVEDNSGKFTVDLAAFVIANGYGRPGFDSEGAKKEYENRSYNTGYFRYLEDLEGVASLKKLGLWGSCQ